MKNENLYQIAELEELLVLTIGKSKTSNDWVKRLLLAKSAEKLQDHLADLYTVQAFEQYYNK